MNNIGIILNQDNNQSYLGKFYNRNRLDFPIIRKIYEQIETNNNNENNVLKNQIIDIEKKNISDTTTIPNMNEVNIDEIENEILNKANKQQYCELNNLMYPNTVNIYNEIDKGENDDIIVLDNYSVSNINKTELNIEKSNKYDIQIENNKAHNSDQQNSCEIGDYIDKNIENEKPSLQFKYKYNNKELIFLWLSSIVILVSIEYNLCSFFKNY